MNVRLFGMTRDGREVQAVRLSAGELTATLLTFGATLQDLRLAGTPWPLTLGSDKLAAYEVGGPCRWMGSIVGPVANRIADSRAELGGEALVFHANEGPTLLHSGDSGTDQQVWTIDEASRDACTLSLALPHGLGGFPGQRRFTARFALTGPATLHLTLTAATDRKDAAAFLRSLESKSLLTFQRIVQTELARLITGFIPQTDAGAKPPQGTPVPWREAYRDLYRFATGWLHWSPHQAWNATPAEITEALTAHMEMLKAIHGSAEDEPDTAGAYSPEQLRQIDEQGFDPELDRAGLQALKAKYGKRRQ